MVTMETIYNNIMVTMEKTYNNTIAKMLYKYCNINYTNHTTNNTLSLWNVIKLKNFITEKLSLCLRTGVFY